MSLLGRGKAELVAATLHSIAAVLDQSDAKYVSNDHKSSSAGLTVFASAIGKNVL